MLGALLSVLAGGCVTREFDHGRAEGGELLITDSVGGVVSGFGGTGDDGFSEGNFPEPAVTRCGDILGDLPAITNLTSAWAVIAVPNATSGDEPVPAGSVLLRLSEEPILDCGSAPEPDFFSTSTGDPLNPGLGASGERSLELLLAPEDAALGVHPLSTARVSLYGEGATTEFGTEATVELFRVDGNCIVGLVRGVQSDEGAPFMEGGFVAETCQRQCIPGPGVSC